MSSLIIDSVSKNYRKKNALKNINLSIQGTFGLLGPNGAGKTTLMRIIATILDQDSGKIKYEEIEWSNSLKVKQMIGYLPQHFSLYPNITVMEALNHLAILKGIKDKKVRAEQIEFLLTETNLLESKNKKIKDLSGGMLRRVGISQALLGNPNIIIIDEPTAGLDIEERIRFRTLLRKIGKDRIVIISTHIVEDVEFTCDNLCVLKDGEILTSGSRQEVADLAKGKIWEVEFDTHNIEMTNLKDQFKVISTKQVDNNRYSFRILTEDKPFPHAKQAMPNIEDSYLLLMGEKDR